MSNASRNNDCLQINENLTRKYSEFYRVVEYSRRLSKPEYHSLPCLWFASFKLDSALHKFGPEIRFAATEYEVILDMPLCRMIETTSCLTFRRTSIEYCIQ